MAESSTETHDRMQCMEVWGGNTRVERHMEVPGLEVWVHSRPYERAEAGGDVYYLSSCASGRITRVLLADVSGHGKAVASVALGLRDLMRRNVNLIKQTRFVRELNKQFSGEPSGERFATALVCTFFAPTQSLQLCSAGHPFPMVYRRDAQQWMSAEQLSSIPRQQGLSDTPLGIIPEADYSRFDTHLATGDMVLCISDAFTESLDSNGTMLGMDGLMNVVRQLDVSHPEGLIVELMDRVSALQPQNLCEDDATAILFRADGSSPTVVENLMAPLRLLSGVRDKTKID